MNTNKKYQYEADQKRLQLEDVINKMHPNTQDKILELVAIVANMKKDPFNMLLQI